MGEFQALSSWTSEGHLQPPTAGASHELPVPCVARGVRAIERVYAVRYGPQHRGLITDAQQVVGPVGWQLWHHDVAAQVETECIS